MVQKLDSRQTCADLVDLGNCYMMRYNEYMLAKICIDTADIKRSDRKFFEFRGSLMVVSGGLASCGPYFQNAGRGSPTEAVPYQLQDFFGMIERRATFASFRQSARIAAMSKQPEPKPGHAVITRDMHHDGAPAIRLGAQTGQATYLI